MGSGDPEHWSDSRFMEDREMLRLRARITGRHLATVRLNLSGVETIPSQYKYKGHSRQF